MTTNEFLKAFLAVIPLSYEVNRSYQILRPYVMCNDGFGISIQASDCHYCEPRISQFPEKDFIPYEEVELGYPTEADGDLLDYQECPGVQDPTGSVYGYVPVEIVDKVLEKHGGIDILKTKDRFEEQFLPFERNGPEFVDIIRAFNSLMGEKE